MSLAWTTVVLLVLLLPGFLFSVGMYAPERISRDVAPRSPLGQLAGVVLVSFLAHAAVILFIQPVCASVAWLPCVNLEFVFVALQLAGSDKYSLSELSDAMLGGAGWTLTYVIVTSAGGYFTGWFIGAQILKGSLRAFAKHGWIYDLIAAHRQGGMILAFVLTSIRHENRVLMYRGFLKDFYTAPDGKIAYLVLKECQRYYMLMEKKQPLTSAVKDWLVLGDTHGAVSASAKQWTYLMIEGEDIVNVVFEGYRPLITQKGLKALDQALNAIERALDTSRSGRTSGAPKRTRKFR